jgi:hypothetical protein
MGSSGGGANPAYLSQGGVPMPGLPIAGQGAPNDNPRNFGQFQEFLPEISPQGSSGYQIMPAGQGPNPSAHGLTSEMFQYRSPQGVVAPGGGGGGGAAAATPAAAAAAAAAAGGAGSDVDSLRQQVAALQAQADNGQFGAARGNSIWGSGSLPGPGGLWSVPPATS